MNSFIGFIQAVFNPTAYADAIRIQFTDRLLLFLLLAAFLIAVPLVFLVDNQWATLIRPATTLQANSCKFMLYSAFFVFLGVIPSLFIWASVDPTTDNIRTAVIVSRTIVYVLFFVTIIKLLTGRDHPNDIRRPNTKDLSKEWFYRGRPFKQAGEVGTKELGPEITGWPSGHSALACAVAIAILKTTNSKPLRVSFIIYAILIVFAMVMSVHWFSDVVSGTTMGIVLALCMARTQTPPYW